MLYNGVIEGHPGRLLFWERCSHALQETESPCARSDHLDSEEVGKEREISLLPATMNPTNPLDVITLSFFIVPLVLQKIQLPVSASLQAGAKS